jgi:curved DNA-binding protein CbpA
MASPPAVKNHYKTLGLPQSATQEEVKAKYRSLVLLYHPDLNDTEEAKKVFLSLQEAFDVLGEEHSRRLYDEDLRLATAPSFRGEPWPSRKTKYSRAPRPSSPGQEGGFRQDQRGGVHQKYNIAEWERAHYGIGETPRQRDSELWATGEREENMSNHQLYFKYRSQRIKNGGGHTWSSKKFSTWRILQIRIF